MIPENFREILEKIPSKEKRLSKKIPRELAERLLYLRYFENIKSTDIGAALGGRYKLRDLYKNECNIKYKEGLRKFLGDYVDQIEFLDCEMIRKKRTREAIIESNLRSEAETIEEINKQREILGLTKLIQKQRECLQCGKLFLSKCFSNRICTICKKE